MERPSQVAAKAAKYDRSVSEIETGPELFLIDGNSLAYRAFFALPDSMATADGRPTNAVFGLASMLVKLIADYRPRQIAVAWDAGMSGREVVYPEYKAQRPPKPDLLRQQWPHLLELVDAFGYTNVKVDGYEADDVIATLARQATEAGIPVVVVTGDRDAYQLVSDTVKVMSTSRGITETKLYDREAVKERYGVYPELVTDLMGLRGDTSDNIPGVPGIGEKTAAQLLEQFPSLEEVLANVDQISGKKRKENLTEFAEDARISKQLATMDFEVETNVDIDELMATVPDRENLRAFMTGFELRAAMNRLEEALGEAAIPGVTEEAPAPAEVVVSDGGIDELAEGPVAIELYGGWAATDGRKVVGGQGDAGQFAAMVEGRPLIGHDIKAIGGQRVGLLAALEATGKGPVISHDTLVAAYLLEPSRRNYHLDELAVAAGLSPSGLDDDDGQMSLIVDEEPEGSIAPEIAATVWNLAEFQRPRLEDAGLLDLLVDIEQPLIRVLAAMERIGLKLDREKVEEMSAGLGERIAELESEIHNLAGREFTIGSPQQVGQVLFEELGLPRKRRGKTGFSTDARVLAQIRDEHEIVALIEGWRELTKLRNTYLEPLPAAIDPATGRVHTTFMQTAAPTGRISSIQPNLQSIPIRSEVGRPLRGCFVAEPGNLLVSADYSQVELRVLAHVADEEVLKGFFRAGEDVHAATAAQVFEIDPAEVDESQRSKAKMVNFGIVYGLTGFGLADRLNIPRSEGEEFVKRYHERFPAVTAFRERVVEEATETGFVKTLLGRRRPLPELRSNQAQIRAQGVRLAMNTVVQGTAADIIKIAMIRSHDALLDEGLSSRLVLQIHDELLFEGPAEEAAAVVDLARREMVGAFDLEPPLEVDSGVGESWLAAK
ncbi:MAG: DNA polymerase I [Solirubrobacterales bacterium]|nr:DNA polymerase I [Solirubrobacterales bacterium]